VSDEIVSYLVSEWTRILGPSCFRK